MNGEQFHPDFLKINPTHTLPALVDEDFIVWDSHAVCTYLHEKFSKDDKFYPKDLLTRTKIDQFLHFDGSTLFPRFGVIAFKLALHKATEISNEDSDRALEALGFVEQFLNGKEYLVGDTLTLADFACVTVPTTLIKLFSVEGKYPNIEAWIGRLAQLPYYHEANGQKCGELDALLKTHLEENKKAAGAN